MSAMTSEITRVSSVCSTVCSDADQRKHQSSALLAFVRGIHRWPVDTPHKWTSNAENVSIWWRHNEIINTHTSTLLHTYTIIKRVLRVINENINISRTAVELSQQLSSTSAIWGLRRSIPDKTLSTFYNDCNCWRIFEASSSGLRVRGLSHRFEIRQASVQYCCTKLQYHYKKYCHISLLKNKANLRVRPAL